MKPADYEDLWFQRKAVPGAAFRLNDSVLILSGEHAGTLAAVISLLELNPHPRYLVELATTGADLELPEAALRAA
jgi:hypothetical protein